MNLLDILKQTIATLRAHKMRSFLTMFGIVWGIASMILLVGLGLGFSKDQKKRMETLGKDLVIVWGGPHQFADRRLGSRTPNCAEHRRCAPDQERVLSGEGGEPRAAAFGVRS